MREEDEYRAAAEKALTDPFFLAIVPGVSIVDVRRETAGERDEVVARVRMKTGKVVEFSESPRMERNPQMLATLLVSYVLEASAGL